MYVLRLALRASTGRPPARFIRGRRYPSSTRPRAFHTSRILTQAANPPSDPDSTPIGENEASKPDREKAAAEEQPEAAVTNDDPDVLAQKLQKSREASKRYSSALRRQQRGRKFQGLPPVHIPDWFLKKRIIRPEDLPAEIRNSSGRAALRVSVSHAESREQATCPIPVTREEDLAQVTSLLVRGLWGRRLDDHEQRKVDAYLTERMKASLEPKEVAEPSDHTKDENSSEKSESQPVESSIAAVHASDFRAAAEALLTDDSKFSSLSSSKKPELAKLLVRLQELENELDAEGKKDATTKQKMKIARWMKKNAAKQEESPSKRRRSSSARLSPLVLTEIRATIAAAISTLKSSGADSFPAAKTNLILHSSMPEHEKLVDACVHQVAAELNAEMIVLGAQDLAQLAGDYLGEGPEPSPRSVRSLGYETYRLSADLNEAAFDLPDADEEPSESVPTPSNDPMTADAGSFRLFPIHVPMEALGSALRALTNNNRAPPPQGRSIVDLTTEANNEGSRSQSQSELQLEDMKIANLLEALIDGGEAKQSRGVNSVDTFSNFSGPLKRLIKASKAPGFFDYSVSPDGPSLQLHSTMPLTAAPGIALEVNIGSSSLSAPPVGTPKIVYVKDFKELNATHYGGRMLQKLEEIVRKRRLSGESIMIVGSTCSLELTPDLSASGVHGLQSEGESSYFRTIVTEVDPSDELSRFGELLPPSRSADGSSDLSPASRSKFQRINVSHIREMLRSLDPVVTMKMTNMDQDAQPSRAWISVLPDTHYKRVLTYDETHRIALTALGLFRISVPQIASAGPDAAQMSWAHVALAMGLIRASDTVKFAAFTKTGQMLKKTSSVLRQPDVKQVTELDEATIQQNLKNMQRQRELQIIAEKATKYEKRLMPGIANPDQIKTTFDQVHVPEETVDSIRTITSLALLRPDAFSYGILATEKISGALLYGPPGTGKTMLAKAVAKESGSTVLEVSGSQIMDKYVGEGEKNVAAIFSLARKLSPCIVFLDEADAIFASRDSSRERSSHRDILNQFLKEWDGLNDLSVFVMVATNRPFDLDDAVIRRLPRRLLVDLPTQADRKEILRIHLRDEQLDASVDLEDLAKRTPFYSGSDLKNVAVAAALTCVKEENAKATAAVASLQENLVTVTNDSDSSISPSSIEQLSTTTTPPSTPSSIPSSPQSSSPKPSTPARPLHLIPGQHYNFPEKRTLHKHHFDQALHEITASISEDMSSLNAIKKFDEQYGDRKGKKRRKDFGFGVLAERSESAARVRV